tara:strand:+ start:2540 stop:3064 length:525 start_codon:yes stop_codon:yes gene_type:complete
MYLLLILLLNLIFSSDWSIDTTYSYIKYIGNHPLHSWSGISNDIDFKLNCDNDECRLHISTPLEKFDSGNDSRDSNMLYYTESLIYPKVSFKSNPFKFNEQYDKSIDIKGMLNFHGIEKEISLKIALENENNILWGTCNFNFNLDVFNIERPSLLMIKINENIKIESKLKITKE